MDVFFILCNRIPEFILGVRQKRDCCKKNNTFIF